MSKKAVVNKEGNVEYKQNSFPWAFAVIAILAIAAFATSLNDYTGFGVRAKSSITRSAGQVPSASGYQQQGDEQQGDGLMKPARYRCYGDSDCRRPTCKVAQSCIEQGICKSNGFCTYTTTTTISCSCKPPQCGSNCDEDSDCPENFQCGTTSCTCIEKVPPEIFK